LYAASKIGRRVELAEVLLVHLSSLRMLAGMLLLATMLAPLSARSLAGAQPNALAALVAAAKQEGTVVVDGPPLDTAREALSQGFQQAYGIPVTYLSAGSSQSGVRVRAERAAGKYLLDVLISGSDTPTLTFLPNGWLAPVEPGLVAPDVLDRRKWKDGHLWFEDDRHTILRMLQFVTVNLAINTQLVKPGEVTTWKSLLDPKWQGKLISRDPTVAGAGSSLLSYFYRYLGPDYVRRLYKDQKPVLSRDGRQSVQWLAQGNDAILLGPDPGIIQQFQKLGYPIADVFPTDGPGTVSGGYGLVALLDKAPHPNAAKLFINWLAGKGGQEALTRSTVAVSLRTDVTYDNVPAFMFPKKGKTYFDYYDYAFVTGVRDADFAKVRELLGL
jgi:iron(III) transport system substrate-binding protein